MSKLRKSLLQIYLVILCISYFIAVVCNTVYLFNGLWNMTKSFFFIFYNVSLAIHTFSFAIHQVLVSICIYGLMYMFLISSSLSPFHTKKLIGKSKLPIGRRKF